MQCRDILLEVKMDEKNWIYYLEEIRGELNFLVAALSMKYPHTKVMIVENSRTRIHELSEAMFSRIKNDIQDEINGKR